MRLYLARGMLLGGAPAGGLDGGVGDTCGVEKAMADDNRTISIYVILGGNNIYFGRKLRQYAQIYSTMSSLWS